MPISPPTTPPRSRSSTHNITLLTLWDASLSTHWPDITRFAAHLAVLIALQCLAQFGLGVYIAYEFLKVPTVFECWDGGKQVEKTGKVTIVGMGVEGERWKWAHSLQGKDVFTTVYFTILVPLLLFLLACILIARHFSRTGLSIRHAYYIFLVMSVIWTSCIVEDRAKPDLSSLDPQLNICRTPDAETMLAAKKLRERIWEARSWGMTWLSFFTLIYLLLTYNAAYLNDLARKTRTRRARTEDDLGLQALAPSSYAVRTAAAPPGCTASRPPTRTPYTNADMVLNREEFERVSDFGNAAPSARDDGNEITNATQGTERGAVKTPRGVSRDVSGNAAIGLSGRNQRGFREEGVRRGGQRRRNDGSLDGEAGVVYEDPFADPPEVRGSGSGGM
ncbi:uncharacterized protein EI97DRAFT_470329 [Westerdykella ornata]|uniref:Uncharacterized protein n=1 Tax=Westerdykella ornata TaxID=318751 RepID=A0A6A6J913_WESOR|nr:uncharacterized protein EI97DRAFT_470329 [Westerdykella ornata]KAF2272478.1 hypothetical protein EI97DRAFT_470329 [Westerdykella ornata]